MERDSIIELRPIVRISTMMTVVTSKGPEQTSKGDAQKGCIKRWDSQRCSAARRFDFLLGYFVALSPAGFSSPALPAKVAPLPFPMPLELAAAAIHFPIKPRRKPLIAPMLFAVPDARWKSHYYI